MQTILDIIKKAGGWHPGLWLKIDKAPFMELVIERRRIRSARTPCPLRSSLRRTERRRIGRQAGSPDVNGLAF